MESREPLREVENLRFRFQMNNRLRLECLAAVSKVFREFGEPIKDELLSSMVFALPQELISGNGHGLSAAQKDDEAQRPGIPPDKPKPKDPRPGIPPDKPKPKDDPRPGLPPEKPKPKDDQRPGLPPDEPCAPGLPPESPTEPDPIQAPGLPPTPPRQKAQEYFA